jgi:hypothetical protein
MTDFSEQKYYELVSNLIRRLGGNTSKMGIKTVDGASTVRVQMRTHGEVEEVILTRANLDDGFSDDHSIVRAQLMPYITAYNDQFKILPTKGDQFLLVGGSYDGEYIELDASHKDEELRLPEKLEVGLCLSNPEEKSLGYFQLYKYNFKEKHYVFIEK